jgi:predicted metal-dependent phosphoesterase TrpH
VEIDLHIHTNRYSGCSNIDAVKLLRKSKEAGLDGIALTEHGISSIPMCRPTGHEG